MMLGAVPNTRWLDGCVAMDANGFIQTGPDLARDHLPAARWPLSRMRLLLETSLACSRSATSEPATSSG
jgi:thioredoxin reductase (NADPH)